MKTTILRIKCIEFTDSEQEMLKELKISTEKELILDESSSQKTIDLLIDVNPDKQEHRDFIMQLIKELKR